MPFPLLVFVQNENKVTLVSVFGNSCGLTSVLLYCTEIWLYCTDGPCTWGLGLNEPVPVVIHLDKEARLSRNLKGGKQAPGGGRGKCVSWIRLWSTRGWLGPLRLKRRCVSHLLTKKRGGSFVLLRACALKMEPCLLKAMWSNNHSHRESWTLVAGSETDVSPYYSVPSVTWAQLHANKRLEAFKHWVC